LAEIAVFGGYSPRRGEGDNVNRWRWNLSWYNIP